MRMKRTVLCLLLLGLLPLAAPARDLTGEFEVDPFGGFDWAASMNGRGEVLVAWQDGTSTLGRLFAPDNTPRGPAFEVSEPTQEYLGSLSAAIDSRGFSVVWDQQGRFSGSHSFRRFDLAGEPVTGPVAVSALPTVDTDPRGNSVVIGSDLQGRRFDSAGHPVGQPFQVAPVTASVFSKVAVDGRGNFVAIWKTLKNELLGRRLDAGGQPRGPVFQIAASVGLYDLAGNGQGSFVALWTSPTGLRARVYKPSGEAPRGSILVAPRITHTRTGRISVAMDAAGRFLATWDCCQGVPSRILGRFFEASGAPLDRSFVITQREPSAFRYGADAAGGPAGEFFVTWQLFSEVFGESALKGRRLQWARRGDDLCRFSAGTGFTCDVVHDGSGPAVTSLFGQTGDQPFLADLDGDGRDDYCAYRAGHFLCDTAHDGGDAEANIAFQGGFPLMGDLDGDGRDDPCVRVGPQVLCDTAHNGGSAEVAVSFGTGTEPLRLGDEDGDGDDDVCILGDGALLCDTGDDGGAAESRIPFQPGSGERFLLGDVNGDGRDDPCLVRGNRLLCDTAHRGSFGASYPFTLSAGEIPLLGDVNGI